MKAKARLTIGGREFDNGRVSLFLNSYCSSNQLKYLKFTLEHYHVLVRLSKFLLCSYKPL